MSEERRSGREPPHNPDLERAVLSAILAGTNPVAMQRARPLLPHPLFFWSRDHRLVWLACLDLDDAGHIPDAPVVADLLSRWRFAAALERLRQAQAMAEADELDRPSVDPRLWRWTEAERSAGEQDSALAAIGGAPAVYRLADALGSFAALERNAQLLRDYYLRRRLIARLGAIVDESHQTTAPFAELVDRAGQALLALGRLDSRAAVHQMPAVVDETLQAIHERLTDRDAGVRTGMADIDDKLLSLRPGGLYILAARPGVGKTSLALRIVQGVVTRPDAEQRVLFFSLEVDRRDLAKKLIAAYGKLPFRDLDMGTLSEELFPRLEETLKELRRWPLELMDVADLSVQQLRAVVKRRQLETKGALKLVVVDYLQLLQATVRDQEEYAKVTEISRVLKNLARECAVPVLALSQMSRESEKGAKPREPRLSDLRGSGSIEQDADAVIFLHRIENAGDEQCRVIKVKLAKNRFGPTGETYMHFYPEKLAFEQAAAPAGSDDEDDEQAAPRRRRAEREERRRPSQRGRAATLASAPPADGDPFNDDAPVPE
ncbi:MAG: AAA family ATPase [Planctomycetota bacterium]|nr:AAA family ATPase [Planctomycetota bacterium]